MSDFAARELHRQGWQTGGGLGKHEDGIRDAIKVKRKNNTNGLGHDVGEQFTFHWWDHVFNQAANSISIDESGADVKISSNKSSGSEALSTKKPRKQTKQLLYGSFVSAGTCKSDDVTIEPSLDSDTSDGEEDNISCDTLERTFKMTGLTGHKAARHGHQLSGKLKRITDHENEAGQTTPVESVEEEVGPKKKRKKQKKKEAETLSSPIAENETKIATDSHKVNQTVETVTAEDKKVIKKKRKKKNVSYNDEDVDADVPKKKKKKKAKLHIG